MSGLIQDSEHLQPFEAPGPKSGDIFARIGCKTGVGGKIFPVGTLEYLGFSKDKDSVKSPIGEGQSSQQKSTITADIVSK
jgi:hypothetical protein